MATLDRVSRPSRVTHPPAVGVTPPPFALTDLDGNCLELRELVLLGPVVLVFFRAAGSPACVEQLRDYKLRYAGLYEAGATLIAICSGDRATALALVERERLPFPVLVDEDGSVLDRWGLEGAEGVTRTATFVLDKSGTVRFRAVDEDDGRTPSARVLDWVGGHGGQGQAQS